MKHSSVPFQVSVSTKTLIDYRNTSFGFGSQLSRFNNSSPTRRESSRALTKVTSIPKVSAPFGVDMIIVPGVQVRNLDIFF